MKEKYPQNQNQHHDWKVFLHKLAPQFIRNTEDITITEDTASFEIVPDQKEALEEHFNTILSSSKSLQAQLSYTARSAQSSAVASASSEVSAMPTVTNLEEAHALMRALFGKDTMKGKSKGCPINFSTYLDQFENGLLISSDPFSSESLALAQRAQNFLCAHFNGVSIHDIRRLLPQPDFPLKTPTEIKKGEGFVQQCFGILRNADDTYRIYFDVAKFLHLVYPPKLLCETSRSNPEKWRVTISLYHLMLYVKQLSQHGILFNVELKHGCVTAYPLVLPHKKTTQKPVALYMLIDDSSSMENSREALFENIKNFLKGIYNNIKLLSITLNIRLFSGRGEFLSYNGAIELFEPEKFFEGKLSHGTALFEAIDCSLVDMQKTLNTHNNLFILVTDGKDEHSKMTKNAIKGKIERLSSMVHEEGTPPPQMYVMGCGKVLDADVLNALANSAGQRQYIAVDNQKAFGPVISNIHSVEHEQVWARITTQIEGESAQHYSLSIALTGAPKVVSEVIIPLSEKPVAVSVESPTMGQELALSQVTLQITRSEAQITMEEYLKRIEEIYTAETGLAMKIGQLNVLGGEIDQYCKKAPQAIVLPWAADLHTKIENYTAKLREQHDRTLSSSTSSSSTNTPSLRLGRDSPISASRPSSPAPEAKPEQRTSPAPS